jgi:chromosomal replication initiator protein
LYEQKSIRGKYFEIMIQSDNHTVLWNKCLDIIKDNVSEAEYKTWFLSIVPLKFENGNFTIQVPSQFYFEYLEEHYVSLLRNTIFRVAGKGTKLMYSILVDKTTNSGVTYPGKELPEKKNNKKDDTPFRVKPVSADFESYLNTNYTFENYIEGATNRLARAAGTAVAEKPGKTAFNPLFIHGNCGVGKTHLCHAIGLRTKAFNPQIKVLYVSAHLFQQQFTTASLSNEVNSFLNFYQQIDLLIIDDIQEFATKKGTQNALFHIFNFLQMSGKQLVFTSDRSPVELRDFEERLISRFKAGLNAEINAPDLELRKAILNKKVSDEGVEITAEVIDFIAEHVTENRCLEGIIISLQANSIIEGKNIDIELAEKVVGKIVSLTPEVLTVEKIRETVCRHLEIDVEKLMSKARKQELVFARQLAMYLCKEHTNHSLKLIGSKIGNRDHATVLYSCNYIKEQMSRDKKIKGVVEEIEKKLK